MTERPERYTFWLVWRDGGNCPTYQHFNKPSALREAERLAKSNPGQVFFVLKSTAGVVATGPEVQSVKLVVDPIPF